MKLVLASDNKGKLREFGALFADHGIEVVSQGSLGVTPCEEPYGTFLENALAKARHAAKATGLPAMADDSGITAHALVIEPGVHSARYSGEKSNDAANNAKLVERLSHFEDKSAHYTCVLVAVRSADDPDPIVCEGCWYGEITDKPAGTGGFGYDPVFIAFRGREKSIESPRQGDAAASCRTSGALGCRPLAKSPLRFMCTGPGACASAPIATSIRMRLVRGLMRPAILRR